MVVDLPAEERRLRGTDLEALTNSAARAVRTCARRAVDEVADACELTHCSCLVVVAREAQERLGRWECGETEKLVVRVRSRHVRWREQAPRLRQRLASNSVEQRARVRWERVRQLLEEGGRARID